VELDERVIEAVRIYLGLTLYRLAILLDVEEPKLGRAMPMTKPLGCPAN
jgi:hypothetical protein